jgi:DsbC/DsbD-like thiol-disulfide interchange protein
MIKFAAVIFALLLGSQAQEVQKKQYVSQVTTPHISVAGAKTVAVELKFAIQPEMHINSNHPSTENLIPTKLTLDLPTDLSVVKTIYPAGKDFAFAFNPNEKLNVYSGEFPITLQVRPAHGASTGTFKVHGDLQYQACNDRACFPPKKLPVEFEVTVLRSKPLPRHR